MTARPLRAIILPLILSVCFLLFQDSNCSTPLSPEERQVPTAPPPAHRDEPPYHPDAAETRTSRPVAVAVTEDDGGKTRAGDDGAAPSSSATASSLRDKDQGGAVGSRHRSALLRPPVLQRSKLARRFLAGVVEGADSAAKASCHSSDVHISCTPPSEH
ncbi:hypothetical protein BAE44_0025693 [Dichanthelium oligosanthes]|uniref:Uncharacterized protein n=1 Tax=Dichanthelium oligosanthes TaxID=888268 RepID=A0A1E5UKA4_9POAL|nr:hypothetical protein BAE44_0025693 [Dichanthelium oligosanthes]